MYHWLVSKDEEGLTLLQFLSVHCKKQFSKRKLKSFIDQGYCLVNEQIFRQGSVPLLLGDHVVLYQVEHNLVSFDLKRILFENEDLIAYNKPAGMVSEPSSIPQELQLVHRLDLLTTGVLLLAKNPLAFKHMVNLFKRKLVRKTYIALVDGIIAKNSGVIRNRLGKVGERGGQPIWGEVLGGQEAITKWEVLKRSDQATLLRCYPITGRTHQLRVHLSGMGHPILGDRHYADCFGVVVSSLMLHAQKIEFDELMIEAPLPEEFQQALAL